MADKSVGNNIRMFREARGLLQKELGEKIGKTGATICNWENGLRDPGADNIKKIAAALEVSPSELIGHNEYVLQDSMFEIVCTDTAMLPEIKPGDRLLVNKADKPRNGDIVVADLPYLPGLQTAPVVRCYFTTEDNVILIPLNRDTHFSPETNFVILGKVVEITRRI